MQNLRRLIAASILLATGCVTHTGERAAPATTAAPYEYSVQENVVYTPADWPQELQADLYLPRGLGPFPAVVLIHGGGWERGERGDMDDIARELARRGLAAVNISYRFAPTHRFPAQLHDVQQAVRWVRTSAAAHRLDPARIGVFGYSSGGHLAALLATVGEGDPLDTPRGGADTRVNAAVAGGAPFDFMQFDDSPLINRLLGVSKQENPALHAMASPLSHVSAGDPPMFIYHGGWDWLVPVEQAQAMKAALDSAAVPAELYVAGGYGHISLFLLNGGSVTAAIDFLDARLRARPESRSP